MTRNIARKISNDMHMGINNTNISGTPIPNILFFLYRVLSFIFDIKNQSNNLQTLAMTLFS